MPVVEGRKPSMRLAREGLHSGACVWAFAKVVPRDAKRLICGVCTCGWPPSGSTQSLRSSMAMKRMLGLIALVSVSEHAAKATGMSAASRKRVRVSRRRFCTDAKVARPTFGVAAEPRNQGHCGCRCDPGGTDSDHQSLFSFQEHSASVQAILGRSGEASVINQRPSGYETTGASGLRRFERSVAHIFKRRLPNAWAFLRTKTG